MEEELIRQQARKLINEKYPHLPFDQWGYFEDMFINGWKQALSITNVVGRSEQLAHCTNDDHNARRFFGGEKQCGKCGHPLR